MTLNKSVFEVVKIFYQYIIKPLLGEMGFVYRVRPGVRFLDPPPHINFVHEHLFFRKNTVIFSLSFQC